MINILIILVFCIGYAGIIFEHSIKINKSAFAVFAGVLVWLLLSFKFTDYHLFNQQLEFHFSEISGILFFLLGAMTIVELIDAHDGFQIITDKSSGKTLAQAGTYSWGGAYSTSYWVDPKEKMVMLFYRQLQSGTHGDIAEKFRSLVYQAIND